MLFHLHRKGKNLISVTLPHYVGACGGSRTLMPKPHPLKMLRIPFRHTGMCDSGCPSVTINEKLVVPVGIEPTLTRFIGPSLCL